jgi:pimeloyl-ACP methyl ester carboxylesterase
LAAFVTLSSGLRLSFADRGEPSDPVVLLLPGPTDSYLSYRPILDQLPAGLRAIAVSPRGHGDSDKPSTGYRVEDFAADVIMVLDALGIDHATLTGHSGSCFVSRRVALDHPERVSGLILEASPTTLRDDPELGEFVASVALALDDPIDAGFVRSFVVDTSSGNVDAQFLDDLVEEVLKVPARVWRETFVGLLRYDDLSDLARVQVPTLLVWGDQDRVVPRAMQDELARRIPAAELAVYPGVGHTPRWEEPSRFAADVAAFVRRHLDHAD